MTWTLKCCTTKFRILFVSLFAMYIVFCWFAVLLRFAVNKLIAMELLVVLIAVYVLWQCIYKYLLAHTPL